MSETNLDRRAHRADGRGASPTGRRVAARGRRGFTLVELLAALTITVLVLTATVAALDMGYRGYRATQEAVTTNVSTRLVLNRLAASIRTGEEFEPYPLNPITDPVNTYQNLSFFTASDPSSNVRTRIELDVRPANDGSGLDELWFTRTVFTGGVVTATDSSALLDGVVDCRFITEHDVGPRLLGVTIDLTVMPRDLEDEAAAADIASPAVRMVTTASPRRID
ncbi:MAG: prepilin-type N-terminal cleavage/methylation domain-containing protein [Planctomycetota bacterium]